jgi:hypothetical protein
MEIMLVLSSTPRTMTTITELFHELLRFLSPVTRPELRKEIYRPTKQGKISIQGSAHRPGSLSPVW